MDVQALLSNMEKEHPPAFTYLGEGVTTTAYLSPCQKFVLKILKTPEQSIEHYQRLVGCDIKSNYSVSQAAKKSNYLAAQEILAAAQGSLVLCWEQLREQTGLLSLHRKGEKINVCNIVLIHNDGRRETLIDVENKCFFIQHKVVLLEDVAEDDGSVSLEKVRQGFDDWLSFQTKLWHRETPLVDSDISQPHRNYGYLEGKLACIDIGSFSDSQETLSFQLKGKYVKYPKMPYAKYLTDHGVGDYFRQRVDDVYDQGLREHLFNLSCEQSHGELLKTWGLFSGSAKNSRKSAGEIKYKTTDGHTM